MPPLVSLPSEGWVLYESSTSDKLLTSDIIDLDFPPNSFYRAHFLQSDHYNLCGRDPTLGPVVLSLKYYRQEESNSYHIRTILRLPTGTIHRVITCEGEFSPVVIARTLCHHLSLQTLTPVVGPGTSQLIMDFDE